LTIVLLIPYKEGCILIADRLNSFDTGSKHERTKVLLVSDEGPLLGCAGDSRFIETFFERIQQRWTQMHDTSYSKFKSIYEKLMAEIYETNKFVKGEE